MFRATLAVACLFSAASGMAFSCTTVPQWANTYWEQYCNAAEPKAFSMPADCSHVNYFFASLDSEAKANAACSKGSGKQCGAFDIDGSKCWACNPSTSFTASWNKYCGAPEPKSWAMTWDCSHFNYNYGSSRDTADSCSKESGKTCHTYDTNGKQCFTCADRWPLPWAKEHWENYCEDRHPKAFAMNKDCSQLHWKADTNGNEQQAVKDADKLCSAQSSSACITFDDAGHTMGPWCLPACLQLEPEWCWATSVSEIVSYWKPREYPVIGNSCAGIECKIASQALKKDCCADKNSCNVVGTTDQIRDAINQHSPKAYTAAKKALSEVELQAALREGPVVILQFWDAGGGGHFITCGGSTGAGGFYFVHDPLNSNQQRKYQVLSYNQILHYRQPLEHIMGTWSWSIWIQPAAEVSLSSPPPFGTIEAGAMVSFKAYTENYLCVDGANVQTFENSNRNDRGFAIGKLGNGSILSGDTVFLRAHSGKYIGISGAADATSVHARGTGHDSLQQITIEKDGGGHIMSGDTVYLKTSNGAFIDVDGASISARWDYHGAAGSDGIITDMGRYQKFTIETLSHVSKEMPQNRHVVEEFAARPADTKPNEPIVVSVVLFALTIGIAGSSIYFVKRLYLARQVNPPSELLG